MSASGSEAAQGLTVAPGNGRPGEGHPRPGRAGLTGRAGWWLWAAGLAAAGVLLFTVYLRLTNTYPEDSDQANLGLQAWDMLHGNLLLHGWVLSDVSFYTTELPQYMLLELILGLNTGMLHAAAAMTYTLALLLAAMLARGRASGRRGVLRAVIAGGIMLAPQLGFGVFVLLLTVGHIGTSIPLLVTWLVLDRARPGWRLAVATGILLTWGAVGDPLVLAVGSLPLALVCGLRVIQGLFGVEGTRGPRGAFRERVRHATQTRRFEVCLAAAAVASAVVSQVLIRLIHALGGFTLHAVTFTIEPARTWASQLAATWRGLLVLFGASYQGLPPGPDRDIAFLHLAGLALVALALILLAWRLATQATLVEQVLGAAIAINVVLYVISNMPSLNPHEMAVVLPCGAALAGRMLVRAAPRDAPAGRSCRRGTRRHEHDGGPGRAGHRRRARAGRVPGRPGPGGPPPGRPRAEHPARVLARRAPPDLRARRLLGKQHRHGGFRQPGQGPRADAVHHAAGPVGVQIRLVRSARAVRQLRRLREPARLLLSLGATRPGAPVLRRPGPHVQRRALDGDGLEPEPAAGYPGEPVMSIRGDRAAATAPAGPPAEAADGAGRARRPCRGRPLWMWAVPFAVLLTILFVRNRFLFTTKLYEQGDAAANSIRIEQAMHFTLLIGNYSREGFSHPGPAYLYVQAFGQWLFQYGLHVVPTAWNAHLLAVFVLNSALLALVVAMVYGWTRSLRAAAACLAVIGIFGAVHPPAINSDWMPYMYVVMYCVFLVAAGSVAAGHVRDAWIFALTGWFLIHGHACFLFIVPVIAAAVIAVLAWPHRRTPGVSLRRFLRHQRRAWIPVVAISALFVLPIAVNLALHWPGDFGKYFAYSKSGQAGGPHRDADRAVRAVVLVAVPARLGRPARAVRGRDRGGPRTGPRRAAPLPAHAARHQCRLVGGGRPVRGPRHRFPDAVLHRVLLLVGAPAGAARHRRRRQPGASASVWARRWPRRVPSPPWPCSRWCRGCARVPRTPTPACRTRSPPSRRGRPGGRSCCPSSIRRGSIPPASLSRPNGPTCGPAWMGRTGPS